MGRYESKPSHPKYPCGAGWSRLYWFSWVQAASLRTCRRESDVAVPDAEIHAPQREAAIFYGMFLRGRPIESLRQEIDVSAKLYHKWMRAREYDRTFRENLRRMYIYRKQVLAIFESLVTSDQCAKNWQ